MRTSLLLWSVLVAAGCGPTDPVDPVLENVRLPLGGVFVYAWTLQQGDSAALELVAQDTIVVAVAAAGETIGALTGLTRLDAYSSRSPAELTSVWYQSTPARLAEVAYRGAGRIPVVHPKLSLLAPTRRLLRPRTSPAFVPLLLQLRSAGATASDSIQLRSDPRIVYEFPLQQGKEWTSFRNPFLETRTVEAFTDLDVGGMKLAAVVRTFIPSFAPDLQWRDYVTRDGLVKRVLDDWYFVTSSENPEINKVDTTRFVEQLELLQYGGF